MESFALVLGGTVALFVVLHPWPFDWGSNDRAVASLIARLLALVGLVWMIRIYLRPDDEAR